MNFLQFAIAGRALDTVLVPFLEAVDLAVLRSVCRELRARVPRGRPMQALCEKKGYYYIILHYFGGRVGRVARAFNICSGRDLEAQITIIGRWGWATKVALYRALRKSHFVLAKSLLPHGGLSGDTLALCHAMRRPNPKIYDWLLEVGAVPCSDTLFYAIVYKNKPGYTWCRKYVTDLRYGRIAAAIQGDIVIAEDLGHSNIAKEQISALLTAAAHGQIKYLEWAPIQHSYYYNIAQIAAEYGQREVLRWVGRKLMIKFSPYPEIRAITKSNWKFANVIIHKDDK